MDRFSGHAWTCHPTPQRADGVGAAFRFFLFLKHTISVVSLQLHNVFCRLCFPKMTDCVRAAYLADDETYRIETQSLHAQFSAIIFPRLPNSSNRLWARAADSYLRWIYRGHKRWEGPTSFLNFGEKFLIAAPPLSPRSVSWCWFGFCSRGRCGGSE